MLNKRSIISLVFFPKEKFFFDIFITGQIPKIELHINISSNFKNSFNVIFFIMYFYLFFFNNFKIILRIIPSTPADLVVEV